MKNNMTDLMKDALGEISKAGVRDRSFPSIIIKVIASAIQDDNLTVDEIQYMVMNMIHAKERAEKIRDIKQMEQKIKDGAKFFSSTNEMGESEHPQSEQKPTKYDHDQETFNGIKSTLIKLTTPALRKNEFVEIIKIIVNIDITSTEVIQYICTFIDSLSYEDKYVMALNLDQISTVILTDQYKSFSPGLYPWYSMFKSIIHEKLFEFKTNETAADEKMMPKDAKCLSSTNEMGESEHPQSEQKPTKYDHDNESSEEAILRLFHELKKKAGFKTMEDVNLWNYLQMTDFFNNVSPFVSREVQESIEDMNSDDIYFENVTLHIFFHEYIRR